MELPGTRAHSARSHVWRGRSTERPILSCQSSTTASSARITTAQKMAAKRARPRWRDRAGERRMPSLAVCLCPPGHAVCGVGKMSPQMNLSRRFSPFSPSERKATHKIGETSFSTDLRVAWNNRCQASVGILPRVLSSNLSQLLNVAICEI